MSRAQKNVRLRTAPVKTYGQASGPGEDITRKDGSVNIAGTRPPTEHDTGVYPSFKDQKASG